MGAVTSLAEPLDQDASDKRGRAEGALRVGAAVLALAYLAAITVYLITHGGWPTPDYLVPPLLLIAVIFKRGWSFLFDWAPFLLLLVSWQATASIADQLGQPVHVYSVADAEQRLFGGRLPTFLLQERFYTPGETHWYDWAATFQHGLHFVLLIAVGVGIWLRSRRIYWRYMTSVMVLFYIGFAGYVLYPAAPPWLAAYDEAIPMVHRVAAETLSQFPVTVPASRLYAEMPYNHVAAMPSLHAAAPMLAALVLVRLLGWRALPALLYPAFMGLSLVYLGEHYTVDVLAGYSAALVAFVLVWVLPDLLPLRFPNIRPALPRLALPAPARWAGSAALPAIAVASAVMVLAPLITDRPEFKLSPEPGAASLASGLMPPMRIACSGEAGLGPSVDDLLTPVAGRYAAYLVDVDSMTCFSLSTLAAFPPPPEHRLDALAARAPLPLTSITHPMGVEYAALNMGPPAAELVAAGLTAEHRYLLVVDLGDVGDVTAAAQAIDDLASRLLSFPPPPELPEEG